MTHDSNNELTFLETHLSRTLKRVTPSNDLVDRLRGRLQMPNRIELRLRLADWNRLFIVFGGVMSGMLLVVTVARALYYLAARRNDI